MQEKNGCAHTVRGERKGRGIRGALALRIEFETGVALLDAFDQ